jgi:hypothetical protein
VATITRPTEAEAMITKAKLANLIDLMVFAKGEDA